MSHTAACTPGEGVRRGRAPRQAPAVCWFLREKICRFPLGLRHSSSSRKKQYKSSCFSSCCSSKKKTTKTCTTSVALSCEKIKSKILKLNSELRDGAGSGGLVLICFAREFEDFARRSCRAAEAIHQQQVRLLFLASDFVALGHSI